MLPTAKAENYFRLTAENWRGVNNEIAAIRETALSRIMNDLANAGSLEGARNLAEQHRSQCDFMVREVIARGQRAEIALQNSYKFDHE